MKEYILKSIPYLVSAIIAYVTAKLTTKADLKRAYLKISKQEKDSAFTAFSNLQSAIMAYCQTPITRYQREAGEALGTFETFADREMLVICSALRQAISNGDIQTIEDFSDRLLELWQTHHPVIRTK